MDESMIRNPSLAHEGTLKIDWVSNHMPVLNRIRERFVREQPLKGIRLVICLHLEAKTAYMAQTLAAGGAQVAIAGSNPLSTQDDVAAALARSGVTVYAWYGCTPEEYTGFIHKLCDFEPNLIMDDGGDLVHLLHTSRTDALPRVIGGAEETTTGVIRLKAMEADGTLKFPMLAVNNAYMKHLFDNRYGTGQSTWDGILRTTNLVAAGKTAVVAGYGWCGKGVAMRAKGLGARVIVCEIDPVKANEALMDGFEVMPMLRAASLGDFFVTVTGCRDVIRGAHFDVMKSGAILANSGHFDVEINKHELGERAKSVRTVRRNIEEFEFEDGRRVYLLGEGRLVNLACADGHPAEIMDLSFSVQALCMEHLAREGRSLPPRVIDVSDEFDRLIAATRLEALGIGIDTLTDEQGRYLRNWHE